MKNIAYYMLAASIFMNGVMIYETKKLDDYLDETMRVIVYARKVTTCAYTYKISEKKDPDQLFACIRVAGAPLLTHGK